jgi:hypothetical protein
MIPANFNVHLTDNYEYGKPVREFLTSSGDCIGMLTLGRFTLCVDVDGDGGFRHENHYYCDRDELTHELIAMIRRNDPDLKWEEKPFLRTYIEIDGKHAFHEVDVEIKLDSLTSPLEMKVSMVQWLIESFGEIEMQDILTPEDKELFLFLKGYKTSRIDLLSSENPTSVIQDVESTFMNNTGLANVVALYETNVSYNFVTNQNYLTVAWASNNPEVDNEMKLSRY